QHAGIAALAHGAATTAAMRDAYALRRNVLMDGLKRLGFEVPVAPRARFYVCADSRRIDADSRRLSSRLLEEAHVAVTPGVDFGAAGEGYLRFSCTASDADIGEALGRIARVLRRLPAPDTPPRHER